LFSRDLLEDVDLDIAAGPKIAAQVKSKAKRSTVALGSWEFDWDLGFGSLIGIWELGVGWDLGFGIC
jgi:hypothetical protein